MLTEEEMREYIREEVVPWWEVIKEEMPDLPAVHKARVLVVVIRDPFYWLDDRKKGEKPPPAKKDETAGQKTLEGDTAKPTATEKPEMIGLKVTGKGTYNNKSTLKSYKLQWGKEDQAWTGNLDPETFEDFKKWAEEHDMKVESVPI